jgi:hypothetical protein
MPIDHETLLSMLTRLKLTAIRDQLDTLLDEAAGRELSLREALGFLCEREVARKDERRIEMATKIAHFPTVRDLDGFDFTAQPSLDRTQIRELAACRWVAHGAALLLLGKTHLAIALGREAIRQGYSVLAADLASARINPEPGQGARLQSADMTRPCAGRGEAEHVVDPVRLAPVEYFRASVVAVGADEDRHLRPIAADRPHQAAEEGADFEPCRTCSPGCASASACRGWRSSRRKC